MQPRAPTIAVSMGDPLGIGPEVLVKALADPALRASARFIIHGQSGPMLAAADAAGIQPYWRTLPRSAPLDDDAPSAVLLIDDPDDAPEAGQTPRPSPSAGAASLRFVEDAVAAALRPPGDPRRAQAIVTAPISKEAWALAGAGEFPGHTELLARRFGAPRVRMAFISERLRVILATAHLPLMRVGPALTAERISDTIDAADRACRALGIPSPRIAVCGLNPHAGEAGLLGDEDRRIIEPAVRAARQRAIDATGPWPADTVYNAALTGRHDIVVAMYHDQGLIPVKLLAFDSAVNVTVGLPVPRTSPDHGTAFDIAGRNRAREGSMRSALALAVRMAAAPPDALRP